MGEISHEEALDLLSKVACGEHTLTEIEADKIRRIFSETERKARFAKAKLNAFDSAFDFAMGRANP